MLFSLPELRDYKSEEGGEFKQGKGEWRAYSTAQIYVNQNMRIKRI